MRCLEPLEAAVKALKREVLALYYVSLDDSVSCLPKIVIAVALAYVLSPLDLIPDFIPVIGLVDDLIIVPCLIWLALRLIPTEAMEAARTRAANEPLQLSKHAGAATIFLLIWLGCFEGGAALAVERWPLAHAHRLPTYAVATALFVLFVFVAVISESEEAEAAMRAGLHRCCCCCTKAWQAPLVEPLLPTTRAPGTSDKGSSCSGAAPPTTRS